MAKLFEPFNLGRVQLKNRVGMPPMITCHADVNGKANDFHVVHYGARALGGVGLIIVEATAIEHRGKITPDDLGIYDDAQIEGHAKIVKTVHAYGTKIALQIAHAGRKSMLTDGSSIAPSPQSFGVGFDVPKEMDAEDIDAVKKAFISAAKRAKTAGYDAVEIHCAHGYLLNQFLSPLSNFRTDEYGGSFENRTRLSLEIVERVKHAVDIEIFVRISATEWIDGGWDIEDSTRFAAALEKLGITLIHVSSGGTSSTFDYSTVTKPLYQVPLAAHIKQNVNVAIGTVGLIADAADAEEIVQKNEADIVFLGRELLRNPQWCFAAQILLKHTPLALEPAYVRAYS